MSPSTSAAGRAAAEAATMAGLVARSGHPGARSGYPDAEGADPGSLEGVLQAFGWDAENQVFKSELDVEDLLLALRALKRRSQEARGALRLVQEARGALRL
eukprot:123703-Prorocentrum_minimum.AAC.1